MANIRFNRANSGWFLLAGSYQFTEKTRKLRSHTMIDPSGSRGR